MSWQSIIGHEAAVAFLSSAWKRGRLGHAYLFVGPHGVGKRRFAREFAKALLCENRAADRLEACDRCGSCLLVNANTHPDLFEVKRPKEVLEFPIRVIKEELLPNLAMKPARGSRKVAIVDDADDLNEEAANAFLKTLEEPPPGSVLILIGGPQAERQLPTIISRCQTVRFLPLPTPAMKKVLAENKITDAGRVERLLRLAGGSPGQAIDLDDDEIWNFRKQMLATLGADKLDEVEVSKHWMEFITSAGSDAAAQRGRASVVLRMLIAMLETAMRFSLGATIGGVEPEEEQSLRKLGTRLTEERLLTLLERIMEADFHVDRRVQLLLAIEALVHELSRP